ncbi:MAG: hypothetical protein QXX87_05775 [Candidatus Jordarchaeales archaeon]
MSARGDRLLSELIEALMQKLGEESERVKRIVTALEVDEGEYKRILIDEVMNEVVVEVLFALLPGSTITPEEVKAAALKLLANFLDRDERIFLGGAAL